MMESNAEFDVMRWKWSGWQIAPVTKRESKRELTRRGEEEEEEHMRILTSALPLRKLEMCRSLCIKLDSFGAITQKWTLTVFVLQCNPQRVGNVGPGMGDAKSDSQDPAIRKSQVLQK